MSHHPKPGTGWLPVAVIIARCALLAGVLVQAALFCLKLAIDIGYAFPLNYGEGIALDRALALARGEALYTPIGGPPFISWNFPPLYPWLCSLGAAWWGPSFAWGRALSAAANLGTAALVYGIARREVEGIVGSRAARRWAVIAALLFLGSRPLASWAAIMRVDSLGIALGLAGFSAAASGLPPLAAGLLLGLGLLCKPSLLAGLLGASLGYARARRWRPLAICAGTALALLGGVSLWEQIATHGWYWRHTVTCNTNPWRFDQMAMFLRRVLHSSWILAALALVGVAAAFGPRAAQAPSGGSGRSPFRRPGLCYLAGAALVSVMVGKIGSDLNYLLDLVAAGCILAVCGAAWIEARGAAGAFAVAAALLAQCWCGRWLPPLKAYYPSAAGQQPIVCALAKAQGPVLSEEPGLVPLSGKPLWLQPFEYAQMARAGTWNEAPLVNSLRRGAFPLIMIRFNPWDPRYRDPQGTWAQGRFTDTAVAALRSAYRPAGVYYNRLLLRPARVTSHEGGKTGDGR